jgi:hypothetical protein
MLTRDEWQAVVDNLKEVSSAADQIIVEQGELSEAFYFIVKGRCGKLTTLFSNWSTCIYHARAVPFFSVFFLVSTFTAVGKAE